MHCHLSVLAALLLPLAPLSGAQLIVNGSFSTNLDGWTTNGAVSQSSDFALLGEDPVENDNALFQTVGAIGSVFQLSFDLFTAGMSQAVSPGAVPDTAFASLYFGDTPFGPDAATGSYSESLPLFDLDRSGFNLLGGGITVSTHPSRLDWVQVSIPFSTNRDSITFVLEELNLNGFPADSFVAIDEVRIVPIPEPSTLLFLCSSLAAAFIRRRTPP